MSDRVSEPVSDVDVLVIGAGQAGLSAAYHLRRRGLAPYRDFVALDANRVPGGAWQHRWPSLTLAARTASTTCLASRSTILIPRSPPPRWSLATTRSTSVGSGCRSSDRSG